MLERKRELTEMGIPPSVVVKKTSLTPKALIHQKFGSKACYKVEEVQESSQNGCPGLAIVHKGPCLYRCRLELPEFSVVSEIRKKKKDAEQSASEIALEKIGINPSTYDPSSVQDPWDELANRLSFIFSSEFLSSLHPLSSHLKAVLRRQGELRGSIPISVLAAYDAKIHSLCKTINPKIESDPLLSITLVAKAASRLSNSIATSKDQLTMQKENLYPPEIIHSAVNLGQVLPESIQIEAVRIPFSVGNSVESLTLEVSSDCYYLDIISQEVEAKNASRVLVSRPIGKASGEIRLYFSAHLVDSSATALESLEDHHSERSLNVRASYLSGHPIYGDAILASIGYTWKSADLFHEDVSLTTYYRMIINKTPSGIYKLSREAILLAELPEAFTTKTNWRGSYPRELLCIFCRQHHLTEPVFSPLGNHLESLAKSPSHKRLHVTKLYNKEIHGHGDAVSEAKSMENEETFRCNIVIFSKFQEVIIECSPKESFKKQNDAIQSASLKVFLWLNMYFKKIDISLEELTSSGDDFDIRFYPEAFFKAFAPYISVIALKQNIEDLEGRVVNSNCMNQLNGMVGEFHIEGRGSGVSPSNGYLVCIAYSVSLVDGKEAKKELVESREEFEFEVGTGGVISSIEAAVAQMSVGQSARFYKELPPQELILASAQNSSRIVPSLKSKSCNLEYCVTMLSMTVPLEDRMEQALFSPPLSKQRVEYAVHHIRDSSAATLVDFGCGSGSLLESLLDYPTSLSKIVGVDISQKGLTRAAKTLHSKLSRSMGIKSALLYDGSILEYDSRLFGFDIGTCLEVIEHMQEHEAHLFGNVVLSSFCPKILIVSTPNYEYNTIIQKSSLRSQSDEATQPCRFRNHDHKFEWTRQEFNVWASELALRHGYDVEFSGVGRTANDDVGELGYASQIAVFKRGDGDYPKTVDAAHCYDTLWEWSSGQVLSSYC